ncbi:MAG: WD40 repeat domain-containing protein [Candidatus Dependentiae bacterium]|nr:WD40 repeat domain-containing protein [Candidatus Dependentiae bacterium]
MNRHRNIFLYSSLLLLNIVSQSLLGIDIGSDTAVKRFNSQQTLHDGDRVAGFAVFDGGLIVNSGTTVIWDSLFPVSGPIALRGTLSLNNNLLFRDISSLQSLGTIYGNNHSIAIADSMNIIPTLAPSSSVLSDVSLKLSGDVKLNQAGINFTGNCSINGGGNILSFDDASIFTITKGSTLRIENVFIKNIGDTSFVFDDLSASLELSNVTFQLAHDVVQHTGKVVVEGPMTLITKQFNWTIDSDALMVVDGITLWVDPVGVSSRGGLKFIGQENLKLLSNGVVKEAVTSLMDSSGNMIDFQMTRAVDTDLLATSTGFLQSQIDALFNYGTALSTSTGFLQSQIDEILCPVNCCNVTFCSSATVDNNVETGDWSFDSKFIAIGLGTQVNGVLGDSFDANVLKIYELVGCTLVLRAQIPIGCTISGEISEVRWHPTKHRLAVGRKFLDDDETEDRLHIFDFDPITFNLTLKSSSESTDVYALAWRPVPLISGNDILAVGRNISIAELALYTVDPTGILAGPLSPIDTDGTISLKALSWNITGSFVAVGIQVTSDNLALQVYTFNPGVPSLTLNAASLVETTPGNPLTKTSATAVEWSSDPADYLVVGLDGTSGELVQVFKHDGGLGTLTHLGGITGLDAEVRSIDFHKDGTCMAVGTEASGANGELSTYNFDKNSATFTLVLNIDTFNDLAVEDVRWSPSGHFLLAASDDNSLSVYKSPCPQVTICDIISRLESLETCCDALKTSTGFLQSELDTCCEQASGCCESLTSRVEILETCCDALKTSTGFLQSEIDTIQLQIDNICSLTCISSTLTLISRVEVLETCCEALKTSTGLLQSQIDAFECDCTSECCDVRFLVQDAGFMDNVATVDWSSDSRFLAVGLSNDDTLLDPKVLKVYELVGSSLVLRQEFEFDKLRDVSVVRWHRTLPRLAVGRISAKDDALEPQLHIFDFNPITYALTVVGTAEIDEDVYALSWRTVSLLSGDDLLAVGRDNINEVATYRVDPLGALSAPMTLISTQGKVQQEAMDWDITGSFVAVGVEAGSLINPLQVLEYDEGAPSLTLNASFPVTDLLDSDVRTVLAVDWNFRKKSQNLLAIGLQGDAGQLMQLYRHDGGAGALSYVSGIDGLGDSVRSLDWHPEGECIALGKNGSISNSGEFRTYSFDRLTGVFTQINVFDDLGDADVESVRWSPNGRLVAIGNDTIFGNMMLSMLDTTRASNVPGAVTVYRTTCLSLIEIISIIEVLETCCDRVRTSTGELQSQLDVCCGSLTSRVEILETCCESLKTSTGFLQSEIDVCCTNSSSECCESLASRIEVLETCCEALKTSTGFLQSEIDVCCGSLTSRVEILETCCEALKTSTGFLQSEIDMCCGRPMPIGDCVITVTGDLCLTPALLPVDPFTEVVFKFSPCFSNMCGALTTKPKVIIDPSQFIGGRVPLPANTRVVFTGEGIVEVHDGIVFDFQGTPNTDKFDWPGLVIEELAIMDFKTSSTTCGSTETTDFTQTVTVTFGGLGGCFVVRSGAQMLLDNPINVIFGETVDTQIDHHVDAAGVVRLTLNDLTKQTPVLTYHLGQFEILYNNHSTLDIQHGTVEFNTLYGQQSEGIITTWHFVDSSSLRISKVGDPRTDGLLRLAPNALNFQTDFDNRDGVIFVGNTLLSTGNIEFRSFDGSGNILVDTVLLIQDKHFAFVRTMVEIYMELTYAINRGLVESPDATILARLGTIPLISQDGTLAAYCPSRDGSVVQLKQGDHDVRYDGALIRGSNFNNQVFTISNCNAATRIN